MIFAQKPRKTTIRIISLAAILCTGLPLKTVYASGQGGESIIAEATEDLPNFIEVNSDIARSGRPTVDGLEYLKEENFQTIINIENNMAAVKEEKKQVAKIGGLDYVSSPMGWLEKPSEKQVNEILVMLQDPKRGKILLHCTHGRDRTGMIFGLYRVFVNKWSPKDAYKEMLANGFRPQFVALDRYFKDKTDYKGN